MKFKEVAQSFAKLETMSSRISMTEELAALFGKASKEEIKEIVYLATGCLKPPYIGTQFAIAQKTMTKVVAHVTDVSEHEVEQLMRKVGDLGSVVEQFTWSATEDFTVHQMYQNLLQLEELSGKGSQENKQHDLVKLLKSIDPVSAKYVSRIILGTLRLGFSDMTIIDALSWMEAGNKTLRVSLEHAYNVCVDIGLIAATLKSEGIEAIKKMEIHVGIPIRPAAAERLPTAKDIIEKLGPCVAQPKLDGFRLQVHINNAGKEPLIRFFSRNLLDMSAMFPELVAVCKELPVKELIIDGEAIVYDIDTQSYVPFQETVKRRRKHGIEELVSEFPLQLNMFDIMFLDGKSLLHKEQHHRQKLLNELYQSYLQLRKQTIKKSSAQMNFFQEVEKTYMTETLQVIQEVPVSTAQELENYFMQEISAGLEGVVVKKINSSYQAGKRNFNWIKLKYHATKKLEDTIDVVILGYYAGRGKRAHFGIGAFLVGIYNKHEDCFETVAKVGTGLTDQEWVELKKMCDKHAVLEKPKNVFCNVALEPTSWVFPFIVCEVLADEVTSSPLHTAGKTKNSLGLALRFPRFVTYRPDKSATETTTAFELHSFQK